jgi:hypothetical protein
MITVFSRVAHFELRLQPGNGGLMPFNRVPGMQPARLGSDQLEIIHKIPGRLHRLRRFGPQLEVCPQGAAQKRDAANLDGLIFQKVDVASLNLGPASRQQWLHVVAVKFMVAHDVNDGMFRKLLPRPFDAPAALMDVASQNYHVGIGSLRRPIAEFQM